MKWKLQIVTYWVSERREISFGEFSNQGQRSLNIRHRYKNTRQIMSHRKKNHKNWSKHNKNTERTKGWKDRLATKGRHMEGGETMKNRWNILEEEQVITQVANRKAGSECGKSVYFLSSPDRFWLYLSNEESALNSKVQGHETKAVSWKILTTAVFNYFWSSRGASISNFFLG